MVVMFIALSVPNTAMFTLARETLGRGLVIAARAASQNPINLFETYSMKTDNPKIYIHTAHTGPDNKRYFAFAACTTWAKTCKEAKDNYYRAMYPRVALNDIKARFAK